MFEKIRKPWRAKNIFAYIIFSLICLVFVFLGVPVDPLSGAGGFAALVNKKIISIADFSQRLSMLQTEQKPLMSGDNSERQKELETLALNQLINEELILQSSRKASLMVSDVELRKQVHSFPAFQEKGRFQQFLYQSYLKAQRLSAGQFEDKIRTMILLRRVQSLFSRLVFFSKKEEEKNLEVGNIHFQLKYIRIPLKNLETSGSDFQKWKDLVKKPQLLEKELKIKGFEWIESSKTSLRNWGSVLPVPVDENLLFESVLKKIPKKGLIPEVILQGDHLILTYLSGFEVKKAHLKSPEKNFSQSFLSLAISQMVLSSWLKSLKNKSRIKINPKIMSSRRS